MLAPRPALLRVLAETAGVCQASASSLVLCTHTTAAPGRQASFTSTGCLPQPASPPWLVSGRWPWAYPLLRGQAPGRPPGGHIPRCYLGSSRRKSVSPSGPGRMRPGYQVLCQAPKAEPSFPFTEFEFTAPTLSTLMGESAIRSTAHKTQQLRLAQAVGRVPVRRGWKPSGRDQAHSRPQAPSGAAGHRGAAAAGPAETSEAGVCAVGPCADAAHVPLGEVCGAPCWWYLLWFGKSEDFNRSGALGTKPESLRHAGSGGPGGVACSRAGPPHADPGGAA